MAKSDWWPCPFCDEDAVIHVLLVWSGKIPHGEILTKECPNCGEGKKEIRKEYRKLGWMT